MDVGKLDTKLTVWHNVKVQNEIHETSNQPEVFKEKLWASVIPQTGSLGKTVADTILVNVTHKVIIRYRSGKNITNDMWFMFGSHRLEIRFILNPYFADETLEIFCEEVIG
ncbi:phage head closure protein [Paenibacillus sp. 19GGS1-52]|uniref:phage head closure protein n=1 Tax=Paenibacillus sp. 19GGS1-52 TaxID=2758563 RepID=UPI001EFB716D|nr:phage head closure protein [Paenibacillus sp. 19GGS1-52]ULO09666.1 phage head closure protein [Paenibacillus sp. 19GGS1-52]